MRITTCKLAYALLLMPAIFHPALGDEPVTTVAPVTAADISEPRTWGGAENVVNVKHLYFSEQPDAETFAEAINHDVKVVIDLREPDESDWDEAGAAGDAGLIYYNVPVASSGSSFDPLAMQKISALAVQHKEHGILLHCSSGNRASAWFAVHLVDDHGMETEPSIALAHKTGLNKAPVEARVREYLGAGEP